MSLGGEGDARIDRGYIRPEDIAPASEEADGNDEAAHAASARIFEHPAGQPDEAEADVSDVPARLLSDLTAHRTAALRHRLAAQPDVAYLAVLTPSPCNPSILARHAAPAWMSCCVIPELAPWADHIDANEAHRAMAEQHAQWATSLPGSSADLWMYILDLIPEDRAALLAHCAALTLDALHRPG